MTVKNTSEGCRKAWGKNKRKVKEKEKQTEQILKKVGMPKKNTFQHLTYTCGM